MTNVEALKALYAALGGDPADVADATTIVGVLNVIAAKYEGADDATANAEAIANIAAVAENIGDGGDLNAKFVVNSSGKFFVPDCLEMLEIPEGITEVTQSTGGTSIFSNYFALKAVTIPSTVTKMNKSLFVSCPKLETITINKAEGSISGAPWGAPETTQIIWNG